MGVFVDESGKKSQMVSFMNIKPDIEATHLQKLRLCMFTFFFDFLIYSRIIISKVFGDIFKKMDWCE